MVRKNEEILGKKNVTGYSGTPANTEFQKKIRNKKNKKNKKNISLKIDLFIDILTYVR